MEILGVRFNYRPVKKVTPRPFFPTGEKFRWSYYLNSAGYLETLQTLPPEDWSALRGPEEWYADLPPRISAMMTFSRTRTLGERSAVWKRSRHQ